VAFEISEGKIAISGKDFQITSDSISLEIDISVFDIPNFNCT
jgi:hypothetical protein